MMAESITVGPSGAGKDDKTEDIVKALREAAEWTSSRLPSRAADEIERLQGLIDEYAHARETLDMTRRFASQEALVAAASRPTVDAWKALLAERFGTEGEDDVG